MNILNLLKTSFIFLGMTLQSIALASTMAFISVDEAVFFSAPAYTQSLNLINTLGNTYLANPQWHQDDSVMLGLGLQTYQRSDLNVNTSVRYIPRVSMQSQGEVLQFRSPQMNNLGYSYDVTSQLLLVDNMLTWTKYRFQPGLIIGIGRSSNNAGNYHEVPLENHAASGLNLFTDNRRVQLAFELGAALDYTFKDVIIECAYRYIDAGQGQLGLSPDQNTFEHLSTGPLHYHMISLGVRFERNL